MVGIVIALICGLIIGCVITRIFTRPKPSGILRIDQSDPDDGPYLFLELSPEAAPEILKSRKYITFSVKAENFISHE